MAQWLQYKDVEKQKQIKPKPGRWQEIIKTQAEINEVETNKQNTKNQQF